MLNKCQLPSLPFLLRKLSAAQPQSSAIIRGNVTLFLQNPLHLACSCYYCPWYLKMVTLGTEYSSFLIHQIHIFHQEIFFLRFQNVSNRKWIREDVLQPEEFAKGNFPTI